jgi:hypothetical protein
MYDKLDALIVGAIQDKQEAKFNDIYLGDVSDEARRIAQLTKRDAYRVVDGRLTALKRRGLIRFVGGAWRIA